MKQHITKEQWNELEPNEALKLELGIRKFFMTYRGVGIGQMIEFLGDDFGILERNDTDNKVSWCLTWEFEEDELVDMLWEAVKYKLNH